MVYIFLFFQLGDDSMQQIAYNCQRLRHLSLANCPKLSDNAIYMIARFSEDIR
jgi:hypothetical protein